MVCSLFRKQGRRQSTRTFGSKRFTDLIGRRWPIVPLLMVLACVGELGLDPLNRKKQTLKWNPLANRRLPSPVWVNGAGGRPERLPLLSILWPAHFETLDEAQTHNQEPIRYANIVKLQYCIHTSNGKVGSIYWRCCITPKTTPDCTK